ncbi:MAG: hypothetical protein K6C97_06285 [Treponema sp.]|nr:hypothetical protein [Treponema sp.]
MIKKASIQLFLILVLSSCNNNLSSAKNQTSTRQITELGTTDSIFLE